MRFSTCVVVTILALMAGLAQAMPSSLTWSGRLTSASGQPVTGPVDLQIRFFDQPNGGSLISVGEILKTDVVLSQGIFQVELNFSASDIDLLFGGTASPWIEVKDVSHNRTYPRQRFSAVPWALRVPVDGKTINYDDLGGLRVGPATNAAPGEYLTMDGSGKLIWGTPAGGGGGSAAVEDQIVDGETAAAPSQNAVFDALTTRDTAIAGKEPALATGTSSQYYRGDKTWQTLSTDQVPETATNVYFTDSRARSAVVVDNVANGETTTAPSRNAVFDALAGKEDALANGTAGQYYRGDKSWQTLNTDAVSETASNQYFTAVRAQSAVVVDNVADSQIDTAPSRNAVFDALAGKEPAVSAGTSAQYYRGDKSWQNLTTTVVTEGTGLYFTDARARTAAVANSLSDDVTTIAPSQDAVHEALVLKEGLITTGANTEYFRGDKTWQTLDTDAVAEGSNQYFTTGRAQTAVVVDGISDGVTTTSPSQNAVFDALAGKQSTSDKNQPNGYAGLDAGGLVPAANLPYSTMTYQGVWNATTNTPGLPTPASCGTLGDYYIVSVGGTTTLDGISSWSLGDWVVCDTGSLWKRVPNVAAGITTINGKSGSTVTLTTEDVAESGSVLYFTDTRARLATVAATISDGVTTSSPSQDAVFDALAAKQGTITAGTVNQYYRGDKSWQTLNTDAVPETGGNQYFTASRAQAAAVVDAISDGVTATAPSQNAVFDGLAGKEPAVSAGLTTQYYRGDKSWQTLNSDVVPEGATNLWYTDVRARAALSGTAPVTYNSGSGAIGISNATSGAAGAMSAADKTKLDGIATGADDVNSSTVATAGAVMDSDFSTDGILARSGAQGSYVMVTNNAGNWNTAYTDRLKWDGGSAGLNAATALTSLGLSNVQNVNVQNSFTQNDAQYLATDEVRARDPGGLKLYDDGGAGLFIEDGGRVGIGTTSPTAHLEIHSGAGTPLKLAGSGNPTLMITETASGNNWQMQVQSTSLAFRWNSAERVRIDSSGRVGIGTTSPERPLEVNSATSPALRVAAASTTSYVELIDNSATRAQLVKTSAAGAVMLDLDPLAVDGSSAAQVRLFRATSTTGGAALDVYKGDNTATINHHLAGNGNSYLAANSGNVGIGTNNPGAKLQVEGDVVVNGNVTADNSWVFLGQHELSALGTLSVNWTGNYKWLKLVYRLSNNTASGRPVIIRFNDDTAANYTHHHQYGSSAVGVGEAGAGVAWITEGRLTYCYAATSPSNWSVGEALIMNLQTERKNYTSTSSSSDPLTAGTQQHNGGVWNNTASYITKVSIQLDSGNFKAGSAVKVFGMN